MIQAGSTLKQLISLALLLTGILWIRGRLVYIYGPSCICLLSETRLPGTLHLISRLDRWRRISAVAVADRKAEVPDVSFYFLDPTPLSTEIYSVNRQNDRSNMSTIDCSSFLSIQK